MIPNLVVSISGHPKTGKSHLALTFPAPMVVFSFDIGLDPVLKKFEGKDIVVKTYPIPIIDSVKALSFQKDLKGIWDSFVNDLKKATENVKIKTLVIDTWTAVYEIARIARASELGLQNIVQHQYGDVYARLRSLIQRPRIAGQNLVLTTYLRDRFVGDQNTGEPELDGWKRTESEVDVVLWTRRDVQTVMEANKPIKKNVITTLIKDNRYDLDINGKELTMANYNDLVAVLGVEV